MDTDEKYIERCLMLAAAGAGMVAPNPMVGAVVVHRERIIGEGYHRQFGGAHAEVHAIASVRALRQSGALFTSRQDAALHRTDYPQTDTPCRHCLHRSVSCRFGTRSPEAERSRD